MDVIEQFRKGFLEKKSLTKHLTFHKILPSPKSPNLIALDHPKVEDKTLENTTKTFQDLL